MKKYLWLCILIISEFTFYFFLFSYVCFAQTSIAVGGYMHSVIAAPNGACGWGNGGTGRIGYGGTANPIATPTAVVLPAGKTVTKVAAGKETTFFLMNDGTVYGCGANDVGQLGTGNTTQQNTPIQIGAGNTYTDIACGQDQDHCLLLRNDGTVWGLGRNADGELGTGDISASCISSPCTCVSTNCEWAPKQVVGVGGVGFLTGITNIFAGAYQSFAIKSDGTVYGWGNNSSGQLGDGTTTSPRTSPIQVSITATVTKIIVGAAHTLFLKNDGTVWACGDNGVSSTCGFLVPYDRNGNLALASITSGALVIGAQYSIKTYNAGDNFSNVAGSIYGTINTSCCEFTAIGTTPTSYAAGSLLAIMNTPTPMQCNDLPAGTWIDIAAGSGYSLFVRNDNTVWGSGTNTYGQLATGTTATKKSPVQLGSPSLLSGITQVAASRGNSTSLFYNGTTKILYSVGYNADGQLGDGTTGNDVGCTQCRWKQVQVVGSPGSCVATILQVELISFNAACKNGTVVCDWSTASEINNDYFEIEKSSEGKNFEPIGKIKGAGNSSTEKNYSFTDETPYSTNQSINQSANFYRLKQTDYDGRNNYYGPISVNCSLPDEWNLILQNFFSEDELKGTLVTPENSDIKISIVDLQGRIIKEENLQGQKGSIFFKMELNNIAKGLYIIKADFNKKEIAKKFINL
ncbi:MAG: T9SS type A sorting domain-containing protein [Bacteroidetes bacterium]|nr:T9SS type A sorting domain-containing protein [Bacteroidota bacterium]